jgi:hypothetical protein
VVSFRGTLTIMQQRGVHTYVAGCDDGNLRLNVQQLFAKQLAKR